MTPDSVRAADGRCPWPVVPIQATAGDADPPEPGMGQPTTEWNEGGGGPEPRQLEPPAALVVQSGRPPRIWVSSGSATRQAKGAFDLLAVRPTSK
jgi:hypothetical protein